MPWGSLEQRSWADAPFPEGRALDAGNCNKTWRDGEARLRESRIRRTASTATDARDTSR
jgi:hypothetical protein